MDTSKGDQSRKECPFELDFDDTGINLCKPPTYRSKAALLNEMTIPELTACFGLHPTMVTGWKRALQEGAAEIFENGHNFRHDLEAQMDELYCQARTRFWAKNPDEVYLQLTLSA